MKQSAHARYSYYSFCSVETQLICLWGTGKREEGFFSLCVLMTVQLLKKRIQAASF